MTNSRASTHRDDRGLSEMVAVVISAIVGIVVAVGSLIVVQGFDVFFERLPRIQPTVEGGGVGTDWVAGASEPMLALVIKLLHVVDLLMGVFILLMVFIHWGAFRRIASRMQPAVDRPTATDGGTTRSDDDANRGDAG